MPVRVLIVDDEPVARRGLRSLLDERGDIEIIGEAANGADGVDVIRRERPDLVFLDVQMPGLDGFGVIRAIGARAMPCVVFVTAFDEYALDAFAVSATDYLLKPFSPERLAFATDRALERIRDRRVVAAHEQILRALGAEGATAPASPGATAPPPAPLPLAEPWAVRLLVSVGARSIVVPVRDVTVFEADGYSVRVCAGTARYTLRESLKELERRLDPDEFIRIHRSAIVRISAVNGIERIGDERLEVVLTGGARLPVSRARRDAVVRALGSIRG